MAPKASFICKHPQLHLYRWGGRKTKAYKERRYEKQVSNVNAHELNVMQRRCEWDKSWLIFSSSLPSGFPSSPHWHMKEVMPVLTAGAGKTTAGVPYCAPSVWVHVHNVFPFSTGLHETLALLTSQLRPDANHKEDMVFLKDVFSERSLGYLMKVRNPPEKDSIVLFLLWIKIPSH